MDQLEGWADYASREPFGFVADDLLSAKLAYVVARIAGSDEATIDDFRLFESLREGPPNEDGTVNNDALIMRLQKLLPPQQPQLLGADGKPLKGPPAGG